MPGSIDIWSDGCIGGWARHPTHPEYPLTLHAVEDGRILASGLADATRADGLPGFALPISTRSHPWVHVLVGETGEIFQQPAPPPRPRVVTVEELVSTPAERPGLTGACVIDAEAAGLLPETIIDLLCRDHLGRPAGPVVTATALRLLHQGGYVSVRRMLIDSSEYRHRRIHADRAPGAIFSQPMVLEAAGGDFLMSTRTMPALLTVSAAALLDVENDEAFITACYRQILRKEPDRAGFLHYVGEIANGVSRLSIIRHLGNEFETVSAGVVITDLPAED